MQWVLIVTLFFGSSVGSDGYVEIESGFLDQAACESAGENVLYQMRDSQFELKRNTRKDYLNKVVKFSCVPNQSGIETSKE